MTTFSLQLHAFVNTFSCVLHVLRVLRVLLFTHIEEFAANMFWALNNTPRRLTPAQRHSLTWEAAMQRYVLTSYAYNQFLRFGKKICVLVRMLKNRFETAALLTVVQQRNSKTYYDGLIAWAIEVVSLSALFCLISSANNSTISKNSRSILE